MIASQHSHKLYCIVYYMQ